jgi:hypothetical protein
VVDNASPELLVSGGFTTLAVTTLFWVARLMYSGRLVPRQTLDDALREKDAWKSMALQLAAQKDRLSVVADVAADVFKAVAPKETP